jgi:hypothetical protein
MRPRFTTASLVISALLGFAVAAGAQSAAPAAANAETSKANAGSTQSTGHVDLSGSWGYAIGGSFSPKGGPADAGTPADGVPYQPWALARLKSRKTMSGPNATFETRVGAGLNITETTDPIEQCDPHGAPRIYTWPAKFKFLQTPDVVYILYEYGPSWRQVWLNKQHPEDPEPSYWGHSIGHYEGNDTLVVDSVGFNDKTWIDDVGRPHTEKLHLTERYRLADKQKLEITITIDDPGAYTATWSYGPKTVLARTTEFGGASWVCTIDQNKQFFTDVVKPTIGEGKK